MAHYYVKHFLPLCVELCRPDAIAGHKEAAAAAAAAAVTTTLSDGTTTTPAGKGENAAAAAAAGPAKNAAAAAAAPAAASQGGAAGGGTEGTDPLSFFPDPTRDVTEHSPVARGVAYIFLKRQQVGSRLGAFWRAWLRRVGGC